jgi:hypothetical protein
MRFRSLSFYLMVIIGALSLACYCQENLLVNPSVEVDAAGRVPGWSLHNRESFTFDREVKHSGESSLVAERDLDGKPFGVMQELSLKSRTSHR